MSLPKFPPQLARLTGLTALNLARNAIAVIPEVGLRDPSIWFLLVPGYVTTAAAAGVNRRCDRLKRQSPSWSRAYWTLALRLSSLNPCLDLTLFRSWAC